VALAVLVVLGCSRGKEPPLAAHDPLADSADQVLYKTKSVLTDGGVMKAEVYGDTAYVFDDNTRVEMRGVRTIFFTVTGARNAVLTSREGTYNTRTNNMQARGDVVVTSEDGRRLTTPVLSFAQARNEISSDTSFTVTDPKRDMTGIGFVSDPDMNNMRCLRACKGSAGTVVLPGGPGDTARGAVPAPAPGSPKPGVPSTGVVGGQARPDNAPGATVPTPGAGRATGTVPPTTPAGGAMAHEGPPSSAAGVASTPTASTPAGSTPAASPPGAPRTAAPPSAAPPTAAPTPSAGTPGGSVPAGTTPAVATPGPQTATPSSHPTP
jgi:LPS export ABC transporter protein LptC